MRSFTDWDITEHTHPSHHWLPDDDIIACDLCGVRTYNAEAKEPCRYGEFTDKEEQ